MAKMVVVQVKCDACGAVVDEAASRSYVITSSDGTFEADFCNADSEKVESIFAGCRPVAKQRKKPGPKPKSRIVQPNDVMMDHPIVPTERPRVVPCDQPKCDYMGADTRSVGVHKRNVHGIKGKHSK